MSGRVRRAGGGRKPTVEKDVTLLADLEALVVIAALDVQELTASSR